MRGFSRFVIAALAIGVVGCSDSATSPRLAPGDRPSLDYDGPLRFGGLRTTTFKLTASGGSFDIGSIYTLNVPANAVCVVGSSYGPGTWDSPCETLAPGQSIQITARYGFTGGGPVVDFSPDIRFAPETEVTLSTDLFAPTLTMFRGLFAANPEWLRYFGIYYSSDFGATRQVDAAFDASLRTHINLRTGLVWRRVKHFSGYSQTSGQPCEPSPDNPDCVVIPSPMVDQP
jgi:hypothetical protein